LPYMAENIHLKRQN